MSFKRERTPVERFYYTVALIVGIISLLSLVGNSISITLKPAPNTIVYADQQEKIYYAPPYIDNHRYPETLDVKNIKAETLAEAREKGHKADNISVEQGYFKEQDTLTHLIAVKLGLSKPKPSRWNSDGSWNF